LKREIPVPTLEIKNPEEEYTMSFIPYLPDINREYNCLVPSIFKTHKVGGIFYFIKRR